MKHWNQAIVMEMLYQMPQEKKEVLKKALERNCILTSAYVLENCTLTVYKEGWLVELSGCRSSFSVYAKDNDGEFIFMRKPNENKLHKLYSEWERMNESDYDKVFYEEV